MTRPRVLVVRSGEKPFLAAGSESRVEVVERVTHDVDTVEPDARALERPFDLVLFTSRIAVKHALEGPSRERLRLLVERTRRGAVGEATASALGAAGMVPEVVGGGSAEALLAALPDRLDGVRILLPCGEDASATLPEGLAARGALATRCVVYRKVARPPDAALRAELLGPGFAAFGATSPAAARWLFQCAGPTGAPALRLIPAVVLGKTTAAFLRSRGVERVEVPATPRFSEALARLEALACPAARK
ncbi:MAG TPA: uroporphyrinogen-III synthase [Thermoanaerobaculia bacterium]|nr:uroporphyrinogen-III synthase [Thermoanaerobaculia bacterium]